MIKVKVKMFLFSVPSFLAVLLTACGGGSSVGIDGTGIYHASVTAGRITNFGSIIVNGIKFDVDNANFIRDDAQSTGQNEYSVGEYVVIKGEIDESGQNGIAAEVNFTNELEGAVTLVSTDGLSLEILGQKVITDSLTVLIGFDLLSNLTQGNIVEVSGTRDANGDILATSIKLKSKSFISGSSENEVKGTVTNLNTILKTFMIGNITVEYENAIFDDFGTQVLVDGLYVEVESNQAIVGNVLIADKVELEDESSEIADDLKFEIEGQITRFASATDFDVNGFPVLTNQNTEYSDGNVNDLAEGVFVEVEGTSNIDGIIVAESIEFEEQDNELDELEGFIESIDTVANKVVVSGKAVIIDQTTIMRDESDLNVSPFTIADLAVNDKVKVIVSMQANGEILASKLERKEIEEENEDNSEDESDESDEDDEEN